MRRLLLVLLLCPTLALADGFFGGGGAVGSGDVEDVWTCSSGNCNALTAASGDSLDASAADSTEPWKTGTSNPATCGVGEAFDNTTDGVTYVCCSTNTWCPIVRGPSTGFTDNAVVRADGASGKVQDSGVVCGDDDVCTFGSAGSGGIELPDTSPCTVGASGYGKLCEDGTSGLVYSDSGAANVKVVHVTTDRITSANVATMCSDETGTGALVLGTSPTIATPNLTGAIDFNDVAVDDDDCTGQLGECWFDSTDNQFECCHANSGTPTALGSGAGSGDITAVGPGYADGAAFTDGKVSTGTTMLVWEGTTDDTNELSIISPSADPGADVNLTLPASTGNICGSANNCTFTAAQTFPDGSASAPGWNFTSVTNTGAFLANNQYQIAVAGIAEAAFGFNLWKIKSAAALAWTDNAIVNSADTSLFKINDAIIGIGTGGPSGDEVGDLGSAASQIRRVYTNWLTNEPDALTIADSGDGNPATSTSTPSASYMEITCSDAQGCEWTLGETSMVQGTALTIVNISANNLVMKHSGGVAELDGDADKTLAQYEGIQLRYASDRWVHIGK